MQTLISGCFLITFWTLGTQRAFTKQTPQKTFQCLQTLSSVSALSMWLVLILARAFVSFYRHWSEVTSLMWLPHKSMWFPLNSFSVVTRMGNRTVGLVLRLFNSWILNTKDKKKDLKCHEDLHKHKCKRVRKAFGYLEACCFHLCWLTSPWDDNIGLQFLPLIHNLSDGELVESKLIIDGFVTFLSWTSTTQKVLRNLLIAFNFFNKTITFMNAWLKTSDTNFTFINCYSWGLHYFATHRFVLLDQFVA